MWNDYCYEQIVTVLILLLFIIIAIEDLIFSKIYNLTIFWALILRGELFFIFNEYFVITTINVIQNSMIMIFLFIIWNKNLIGGGDIKALTIFLIFTPPNTNRNLIAPSFNLEDRIQFFTFLLIMMIITKSWYNRRKNMKKERKIIKLGPCFLIAIIFSIIF